MHDYMQRSRRFFQVNVAKRPEHFLFWVLMTLFCQTSEYLSKHLHIN